MITEITRDILSILDSDYIVKSVYKSDYSSGRTTPVIMQVLMEFLYILDE